MEQYQIRFLKIIIIYKTAIESRQTAKEIHLHMIKAAFQHKKAIISDFLEEK